ncbi:hypothetical protein RIF29_16044 [Crotalaria pallida]|uniref:RNase H type-1 domain-containing protein n=1 Tax=Crotalaria pallida TaxID=3830 RepID=A0AAN9ID60_CROPI
MIPNLFHALGVLWCIEILMETGISHVTIHTDCLPVVQCWKKKRQYHTYFEEIIQDNIDKGTEFHDLMLVHVRRNLNKIADFLANFAFDSTSLIWLDEVPSFLQQLFTVVFNPLFPRSFSFPPKYIHILFCFTGDLIGFVRIAFDSEFWVMGFF